MSDYQLAVEIGHSRMMGKDIDGTLPYDTAQRAGEKLIAYLNSHINRSKQLPDKLTEGHFEVEEECFELLNMRLEAWKAFVALDESYADSLCVKSADSPELCAMIENIMKKIDEFDVALKANIPILDRVSYHPWFENMRRSLKDPYNLKFPWFLNNWKD